MTDAAAPSLRRAMGLRTAVSTSTGLAFAALEYLAAAGLVAYVAGDAAWIAIGVAGLLALLAWACFGELNGMFPTAAAIRIYMQRAMDDRVALIITFTYMTTIVLVIAADAFIVGAAVSHVLHESSWFAALWIALLLAVAVAANLRGVRVAGAVQDVATFTALGASAVTAAVALVRSHHALRFPLQPLHGHSFGSLVEAVALGVFLYSAFEWVTTNAEEVRRPAHVHRAMLAAVGILFCACSLMTVAMSHVLDHGQLTSAFPQLWLGSAAFGGAGLWVMAAVTAVTALNTFNGGFITVSRFVYATAREGSLPRGLARLNSRAVPWAPVVALGVTSATVAALVEATHAWATLVAVGAALEAMIYAVAAYSMARLRTRAPDHDRPFRTPAARLLGWAGVALFGAMAAVASVTVSNRTDVAPLIVILVAAAVSALYVLVALPRVRAAEAARRQGEAARRAEARARRVAARRDEAGPSGEPPSNPDQPGDRSAALESGPGP